MKPGKPKLPKAPSKLLELREFYSPLTREEDDERVKRLARKILRAVEGSRKRGKAPTQRVEDLFESDFEKSIGI